jgi:outer membrane lipoprotein SlyB
MKYGKFAALSVVAALAVEGCAAPPPGPTVFAARGQNVTAEQYGQADGTCQRYAYDVTARQADAANSAALGAGVLGTVIGAGLGAVVGGGRGAAVGAVSGAAVGGSIGANRSAWSNLPLQQRYNSVYLQCMQANGNAVPQFAPPPVAYYYVVPGGPPPPPPAAYYAPPPPAYYAPPPPPPPGYYPPPPPPPGY